MVEPVIPNIETAKNIVRMLFKNYHSMVVTKENDNIIEIEGFLKVYRSYNSFVVDKEYLIRISLPIGNEKLPYITDIDGCITNYHKEKNGILCLSTPIEFRLAFIDGFNIIRWMKDFVEPFYFSYEYYKKYEVSPFGDYSHGIKGLLENYAEILEINNKYNIIFFMMALSKQSHYYRQMFCLCGSGFKARHCHKRVIKLFLSSTTLLYQLQKDLNQILSKIYDTKRTNKYA